jgi:hypothetical protein
MTDMTYLTCMTYLTFMIKQLYKTKKTLLFVLIALATMGKSPKAQVSVSGPLCVIPGITYQYIITGNWNSSSTMKVCIKGGLLSTGDTCTPGSTIASSVFVVWSNNGPHKLKVTSSSGNMNVTVQRTRELKGGLIHNSDRAQLFNSTVSNYTFRCEAANGGSCNPNYSYQWQRSEDGLNWTNITGANGKDLQFSGNILVNTLFRRVTTETNSNSLAYSDIGTLVIPFQ